jgi:hypothetical protein
VLTLTHRELGFDAGAYHHLLDGAYAVAMAGAAVAVTTVAAAAAGSRPARIAGRVASVGFGAMGIESGVGAVHRVSALGPLFTLGIAAAVLGALVLAVVGARAARPRWLAVVPLGAMVVAASGGEVGASLLSAAAWALAGRVLGDRAPAAAEPVRAGSTWGSAA